MLGFFIAFAVKLPVVPFHTWLPDAHTEAPTAGASFGRAAPQDGRIRTAALCRAAIPRRGGPVCPRGQGARRDRHSLRRVLAFAQSDLKRLIAYTSVSHMGFVLLGVFAWNELAFQGVVMQIVCHGITSGRCSCS